MLIFIINKLKKYKIIKFYIKPVNKLLLWKIYSIQANRTLLLLEKLDNVLYSTADPFFFFNLKSTNSVLDSGLSWIGLGFFLNLNTKTTVIMIRTTTPTIIPTIKPVFT